MIRLTRLSGSSFVLNSDLIERIDETPDTVITLGDGTNYVATESVDAVVRAIRLHRAEIIALSETVRISLQELEAAADARPGLASVTDLPTAAFAAPHEYGADA
jgi:flagellar protein FlbD